MTTEPLVVPIILVTGSLHFAEVDPDARAQQVVQKVLQLDGVSAEVLGDLEDSGWALQRIRVEQAGRVWEEDELSTLGDGALLIYNPVLEMMTIPTYTVFRPHTK